MFVRPIGESNEVCPTWSEAMKPCLRRTLSRTSQAGNQVAQTCFSRSAALLTNRTERPQTYETGPRYSLLGKVTCGYVAQNCQGFWWCNTWLGARFRECAFERLGKGTQKAKGDPTSGIHGVA